MIVEKPFDASMRNFEGEPAHFGLVVVADPDHSMHGHVMYYDDDAPFFEGFDIEADPDVDEDWPPEDSWLWEHGFAYCYTGPGLTGGCYCIRYTSLRPALPQEADEWNLRHGTSQLSPLDAMFGIAHNESVGPKLRKEEVGA